jgi:hypothetical protein
VILIGGQGRGGRREREDRERQRETEREEREGERERNEGRKGGRELVRENTHTVHFFCVVLTTPLCTGTNLLLREERKRERERSCIPKREREESERERPRLPTINSLISTLCYDKRLLIITLMLPFLVDKSISLSTRIPTLTCSVRGGKRGLVTSRRTDDVGQVDTNSET